MQVGITKAHYGTTPEGTEVDCYTLTNGGGLKARVLTLGATLAELHAPDRSGKVADITLGFEDLAGWLSPANPYMGCTVGRYANRIAKGRFVLDGRTYSLAVNNGSASLHGGRRGFNKAVWKATEQSSKAGSSIEFRHTSPDGDEGYPGTLQVAVTYTLTESNALRLDYVARTDKPTVLNLTNHTYWNLAGDGSVLNHVAQILASRITEVDAESLPTGKLLDVQGTPFDFSSSTPIGLRIPQIGNTPAGYDHNYVLDAPRGDGASLAARVEDPDSGRVLEVLTTEPGVQFYTGNHLDGSITGKRGRIYDRHAGFCLETQHYPDSPNHPHFPKVILRPGEEYRQTTLHRFSTTR